MGGRLAEGFRERVGIGDWVWGLDEEHSQQRLGRTAHSGRVVCMAEPMVSSAAVRPFVGWKFVPTYGLSCEGVSRAGSKHE